MRDDPLFQLRRATEADASAIANLLKTASDLRQVSPLETFPLEPETVRHWIRQRAAGYVLLERGEVVGYGELVADPSRSGRFWIGHMMIRASRRGLGLGRRMVASLLRVAIHERQAREIAISAFEDNPGALRCYRSCGFVDRGRSRVGDRTLVEMRWKVRGRQRVLPRAAVIPGAFIASAVSVLLLPEPARRALIEASSPLRLGALAGASVLVAALATSLQPLLPEWRRKGPVRWLRTAAYPLAVAALAAVPAGTLLYLGLPEFAPNWWGAVGHSVRAGVLVGAMWSVFLVVTIELTEAVRRKRSLPMEE